MTSTKPSNHAQLSQEAKNKSTELDRQNVHFHSTTTMPPPPPPQRGTSSNSTATVAATTIRPPLIAKSRQKIGKLNIQRDVPIFISVFATLLFLAYVSRDIGRPQNIPKGQRKRYQKPTSISQLKESLLHTAKDFQHEQEGRRRKTKCDLFLGESTIPSAGLSWYAGRSYHQGEPVLPFGKKLRYQQQFTDKIWHNELFLKHHPSVINIKRNLKDKVFLATRNIQAGEELFLSFNDHPQSVVGVDHPWFKNIPTIDDYTLAEKILLMEADNKILQLRPHRSNIGRLNIGSNAPLFSKGE
jgi:hypothetical protein